MRLTRTIAMLAVVLAVAVLAFAIGTTGRISHSASALRQLSRSQLLVGAEAEAEQLVAGGSAAARPELVTRARAVESQLRTLEATLGDQAVAALDGIQARYTAQAEALVADPAADAAALARARLAPLRHQLEAGLEGLGAGLTRRWHGPAGAPSWALQLLAILVGGGVSAFAVRHSVRSGRRRMRAEALAETARATVFEQGRLMAAEHALVEQLQQGDRLKTDLLATVSHELRTPLTSMVGALATLHARDAELGPPERRELTQLGLRQAGRLQALIEQLLVASSFEQSAAEAAERPRIDLGLLARQAVADALVRHPGRPIAAVVGREVPVRADAQVVEQIIDNLVGNACKYSPDGGMVRVLAGRSGRLGTLAVEDRGPGVAPADRERIFERFTQLEGGATRRNGGVGLGLYIARQLARSQGGELMVSDALTGGSGARFELRLPLAPAPAPAALRAGA